MTRHPRRRLRARVLKGLKPVIGIVVLLAFYISPGAAQESPVGKSESDPLEEVIVTGSRLPTTGDS